MEKRLDAPFSREFKSWPDKIETKDVVIEFANKNYEGMKFLVNSYYKDLGSTGMDEIRKHVHRGDIKKR